MLRSSCRSMGAMAACFLMVAGCMDVESNKGARHKWLAYPPREALDWDWARLAPEQHYQVTLDQKADAAARLSQAPYVELARKEAASLAGQDIAIPNGSKAYLVRAVGFAGGRGKIVVYCHDNNLWVRYGALGNPGGAME